jgi:DNA ligase-1
MMAKATNDEWNHWYRRILIKDLRCGVSDKTINKVCKTAKRNDLMVPVFSCQLAKDSEGEEPTGTKAIEVKLDGMRVLTVVYPNKDADDLTIIKTNGLSQVEQFSRNGKELHNFKTILDEIAKVGYIFNEPMVLDGEVMSASFQDLMKQAHRKRDVDTKDAILHLFDIITLKDFKAGKSKVKLCERRQKIENFFTAMGDKLTHVELLGQEIVDMDTVKGKARFREINADAIARGFEGIMIKDLDSPYECKRTDSWMKMKPFIEVSLNIVAFEEGTGKNVGKLGAFVCEGVDAGKLIRVNVGSGFSDLQRDEYWQNRNTLLNDVVEVRADAVTRNQEGDYSLRFPRFKTFRGFDPGEKI